MLWSALLYPLLPLERQGTPDTGHPRAVTVRDGARRVVLVHDALAGGFGVQIGQSLKSALALLPELRITEFDEREQTAQLEQLTLQALRWSSRVVTRPPDTVLVEVQGSLRLFGGLEALLARMRSDAALQGLTLRLGTAPTPAAAALLARAGRETAVRSARTLAAALADVPLEHLATGGSALEATALAGLRRSGIRSVGRLAALPPAAVTRRFGHRLTELLHRLDGRLPDPQTTFVPPPTFAAVLDLPLEAHDTSALAFVLKRLLAALEGFLRSRDLGVTALELRLCHRRHAPTVLSLRLHEPTGDTDRLRALVAERLERTALSAPVTRLALETTTLVELARAAPALIGGGADETTPIEAVLDRLVARLGERAVRTALAHEDHRPEKAWRAALLDTRTPPARWPARPLWLLHAPRVATEPLVLGPDAERIENGWWDESDVRRDYFIARDERGTHYWVFRERQAPETLWVHGVFA